MSILGSLGPNLSQALSGQAETAAEGLYPPSCCPTSWDRNFLETARLYRVLGRGPEIVQKELEKQVGAH